MKLAEISEVVKIAIDSIKANKLRSLLASLGVVIGISFVILMGWILSGLDKVLEDTINMIGTDMLYVDKWDWSGGKNWKLVQQRKPITLQQANELIEKLQSAELAIPIARKFGSNIKYNNTSLQFISIQGTKSEYGLTPAGDVHIGRFFNKLDETRNSKVVVLGYGIYSTLFNEPFEDPTGKEIKIDGHKFTIIGVVKKQGTVLLDFIDNQMYIPLPVFTSIFGVLGRSISIGIKAGSEAKMDEVRAETRGHMRTIRNLKPWEEDDFSINETKAFERSVSELRLYVWGIGIGMTVLSFIVGMIGIMNIMFVSVAERTKEIGIRKAIGAKRSIILFQFLIESSILCLFGAFISFIFCSILIYLIATFLPKIIPQVSFLSPFMSPRLLLISSSVSIIIGVLAGLLPAIRASKLDPVEALRYE